MSQFALYKNPNKTSRATYPYLLDVQSELLTDLNTRVVIPVVQLSGKPISHLCPLIEFEGKKLVLLTQQLAGISAKELGKPVADLSHHRDEIIAALDFLFTGI